MNNARFISILFTGASAFGFTAAVASAQHSINSGSTGMQYANDPLFGDNAQSIGMRQAGEQPGQQMAGARVFHNGRRGAIDVALDTIAATTSISRMLNARATVAQIDSTSYEMRRSMRNFVVTRIAATDDTIKTLVSTTSEHLTGETRAHAIRGMRRHEQTLEMALLRIGMADPSEWFTMRSNVANDYQQFADAASHAEDVARGTGSVTSGVGITGAAALVLDQ
jgi:hypothetical protein